MGQLFLSLRFVPQLVLDLPLDAVQCLVCSGVLRPLESLARPVSGSVVVTVRYLDRHCFPSRPAVTVYLDLAEKSKDGMRLLGTGRRRESRKSRILTETAFLSSPSLLSEAKPQSAQRLEIILYAEITCSRVLVTKDQRTPNSARRKRYVLLWQD